MRYRAGHARESPQERTDAHAPEARRGGVDAEHGPQQLEVRARSPGVALGARGVFRFRPRREAQGQHPAPGAELIQEPVALAGAVEGRVHVMAEIDRARHEIRLAQDAADEHAGRLALGDAGEDGEDVGVLGEVLLRGRVGVELPARVPVEPGRLRAKPGRRLPVLGREAHRAQRFLQVRGLVVGDQQLQVDPGRGAGRVAGVDAA